ncbi:MAG: ribosomal RNA small subunit methyltransferase A [Bdellovibrionales bacterium]|nr:ribosomal RNA small subunit methyltransferase A [Bdellovibrionales bacterium]
MKEYEKEKVLKQLQILNVSPKRSLGQNFLIGTGVIEKIIQRVQSLKAESLVEIGPGLGALTEHLLMLSIPLKVIELDRIFAGYWREKQLDVREGDALQMDWGSLNLKNACLVSNLPYQISSSIVVDRTVQPFGVESMVLMFQKEVAQRIIAQPKSKQYGLLTVIAQAGWDIETVLEAGPNEFYPPPNVASRVLLFKKKASIINNFESFLGFVKAGFAQRRKFLLSNLKEILSKNKVNRHEAEIYLLSLGYTSTVRAEELTVEHWQQFFNKFVR